MRTDSQLIEEAIDILHKFTKEIEPSAQRISSEHFLLRALKDKRAAISEEEFGVSFGICRAITHSSFANLPGFHMEGGSIVYVDFIYTANASSATWLKDQLIERFKECKEIAFHRKAKTVKKLRIYPISKIERLITLIGE